MRDTRVEQPELARWLVFDSSDDFSSHCWLAYLQCLQQRGECDMSAPCVGFTFDAAQDAALRVGLLALRRGTARRRSSTLRRGWARHGCSAVHTAYARGTAVLAEMKRCLDDKSSQVWFGG